MANIITGCRILFSIVLLLFPVLSPHFLILYLICGFTDMIDGITARKTNNVSEFGAKLDTVADFIFVAICMIKYLPVMDIPMWLWIWITVITVIKIINIAFGIIIKKKWIAEHTIMNKITGLLLFMLPLTVSLIDLKFSAMVVCMMATFAAIQEGYFVVSGL